MPSFEFGPTTTDAGMPVEELTRALGRIEADGSVVVLEIIQGTGQEGDKSNEMAIRWLVGLRMQPDCARMLAGYLIAAADKAQELS